MAAATDAAVETLDVMIWAKTYPELSTHHVETVCTAGVTRAGQPVRLYPVPLRYMQDDENYRLYDIVRVSAARNSRDDRPESRKLIGRPIEKIAHVDTDPHEWAARREWIWRDSSWHAGSVMELKARQQADGRSLGFIAPGEILDVRLRRKTPADAEEFERKWAEVTHEGQGDLFPREFKKLSYLPVDVILHWRCPESADCCAGEPHKMKVLDWGLLELGRRVGWEKAKDHLGELANLSTHDFRLYMGNFFNKPWVFGIIALWYPQRRSQRELF